MVDEAYINYSGAEYEDILRHLIKKINSKTYLNDIKSKKTKYVLSDLKIDKLTLNKIKQNKKQIIRGDLPEDIMGKIQEIAIKHDVNCDSVKYIMIFNILLSKEEKKKVNGHQRYLQKQRNQQTDINRDVFGQLDVFKILYDDEDNDSVEDDDIEEKQLIDDDINVDTVDNVYCLCKKPYVDGESLIGCDECDEFYHPKCIKMKEDIYEYYMESGILWFCEQCA